MSGTAEFKTRSLRADFILLCVPVITLVLVARGAIQYVNEREQLTATQAAAIDGAAARLAVSLPTTVWTLVKDQAAVQMTGEMAIPDIEAIVVRADDGSVFSGVLRRGGQVVPLQASFTPPNGALSRVFEIRWEKKQIAQGEIFFVQDLLVKRLNGLLLGTLADTLIVDAILGVLLLLVVSSMVTRPIRTLTQATREIARTGDLDQAVAITSRNEVGVLADSFRELVHKLKKKTEEAESIAAGDLTVDIAVASERDAFGKAFQKMARELQSLVGQLRDAAARVATGSGEISAASQTLSQGATAQAASLEEISSSSAEVGSQARSSADNAGQADELVTAARRAAQKGDTQMKSMVGAMKEIDSSSQQIAKIIKVIDDIAFQTNLLALNAAVEAARAGKHGKGFAVVAEEVRNLAGRSAKAARETAELIEGAAKKAGNGLAVANSTQEVFDEIVENVGKAAKIIGEIAAAVREQAQGISQISDGLGQIDQVALRNTASAEQTASAAKELSANAAHVRELLRRFKVGNLQDGGDEASKPAARSGYRELSFDSNRENGIAPV
jgi:methyl-accepting chemotaxis protein